MDTQLSDPVLYRNAMSHLAGHVQIVTTEHEGERRGVTITAACSVSDNPATVLVCLNAGNARNALFQQSGKFALNALGAHHEHLANAFSGRDGLSNDARFAAAAWVTGATGAPILDDAITSFDCRITDIKLVATHMILIGQVCDIRVADQQSALIYLDRHYRTL